MTQNEKIWLLPQVNAVPSVSCPDVVIDYSDKDVVVIFNSRQPNPDVIPIHRDKLDEFINLLNKCK